MSFKFFYHSQLNFPDPKIKKFQVQHSEMPETNDPATDEDGGKRKMVDSEPSTNKVVSLSTLSTKGTVFETM